MQTNISILRGINVSGQKKIIMTDLVELYKSLKFKSITTYIQSGNVIFKSDLKLSHHEFSGKISKAILKKYGFDVPVIIRTIDDLEQAITKNPFKNKPIDGLYATFLAEMPSKENIEKLISFNFEPDKFFLHQQTIYLSVQNYGNTKLSNNFFESKLKVTTTTRNWKTVLKLVEIAKSL